MKTTKLVTVVGVNHYHGMVVSLNDRIILRADKANKFDAEAVSAEMDKKGIVGYVANSVKTNIIGCSSAGNIVDYADKSFGLSGRVRLILEDCFVVEVEVDL